MAAMLLCIAALTVTRKVDDYTLSLFQGSFVVRRGSEVARVPLNPPEEKPILVALFRRDRNFAVWDDRGLTVRTGRSVHSTRLPDIAVTRKLFPKEEILKTVGMIHQGVRRKEADSLAGSRRIGHEAYFLLRWNETSGKPWLEALVSVDLAAKHPEPVLIGRFEGISTAEGRIADKLFLANGCLCAATRREHDWGIASYSPTNKEFLFRSEGNDLVSMEPTGLYIERTPYGTNIGGRIDLKTGTPTRMFEDRSKPGWMDAGEPALAYTTGHNRRVLRNCDSGAELLVSDKARARRCGKLVIVWSPPEAPSHAYLYDPVRWDRLAAWKAR
jgi:hypothetical protein